MTRAQAIARTEDLRGRFDAPFNLSDKAEIESLYKAVLGRTMIPTSCQTCYHDALIEIYLHLKRNGIMAEDKKYLLKAGAIIISPIFDNGTVYSNANLTDDVAKRYLEQFPEQVVLFAKVPETAETAAEGQEGAKVDNLTPKAKKRAQKGAKTAKGE